MNANVSFHRARWLHAARVGAGVVLLWGVERACDVLLRLLGLQFPSSVAGMLLAFGALLGLRLFAPLGAERVAHALAPARVFLTRWMALFFVPPLVQLPLNPLPAFTDLLTCVLIVVGGFGANLVVTAWVASRGTPTLFRASPGQVNPSVWSRRSVLWVWGATTVGGLVFWTQGIAVSVCLIAYGLGVAVLGFVAAETWREWLSRHEFEGLALMFHPVLVSACFAGVFWRAAGQPLTTYLYHGTAATLAAPGNWLMALLAPAVVALGLILDTERDLLRANIRSLLAGTTVGSLFSLVTSAVLSRLLDLSELYARALLPRAVTTPVALVIANMLAGNPGLTAAFVITSGVLGALFATPILRRLGFTTPFVQGVATGVSSHGIGTAGLVRDNPQAAAFSAISFALAAALSVGFASIEPVRNVIEWLLAY